QDPRVRQGLLYAVDRDSLREFLFPGIPNTSADTFITANNPQGSVVGTPFARYPYDPDRALVALSEAGWTRAADGRLLDSSGAQFQIQVNATTAPQAGTIALIAANFRSIGIDAVEYVEPPQVASGNTPIRS